VAANLTPEEIGSFVRDGFLRVEPLEPVGELEIDRTGHVYSPVEEAIRLGFGIE
jgi:hypothetical protein